MISREHKEFYLRLNGWEHDAAGWWMPSAESLFDCYDLEDAYTIAIKQSGSKS